MVTDSRHVERAGVRAAQSLFESAGCIFQEVSQQNDFGKDAYVDLVDSGQLSPLCIALQIKSGRSYKARGGGYFIPVGNHEITWRESTLPVVGVVYDPDDDKLRWTNLTAFLLKSGAKRGKIPVAADAILSLEILRRDLFDSIKRHSNSRQHQLPYKLVSDSADAQREAVIDAWALARNDPLSLIFVRRLLLHLEPEALRRAIWALAHATPHPDIFWTEESWLGDLARERVRRTFKWSSQEVIRMFSVVEEDEWGRGTLGQSLDMLLRQDEDNVGLLMRSVCEYAQGGEWKVLAAMIAVALSLSHDPRALFSKVVESCGSSIDQAWALEIGAHLKNYNQFDLY